MAMKENFISMAPDEESNAKVSPIDNNKTLMIDQYTSDVEPGNPEFVEDIRNINDAFAHFNPSVEVDFVDEEGGSVNEVLHFNELRDFEAQGGKGRLVTNSQFLSGVKQKIDTSSKIRKSIEQNRKLRDILKDASATAIYGSRAANGVVVVTTKAPQEGQLRVSYNLNVAISAPDLSDYHLLNAREKAGSRGGRWTL